MTDDVTFDPRQWLESGRSAVIAGLALRPQAFGAHMILSTSRGQAYVYYLRDDRQNEWMLKKFRPGRAPDAAHILAVQALVPRESGFESAFQRRCIRRDLVSPSGFATPEFLAWVEGTLLMPRVIASDWSGVLDQVREGIADLSLAERVTIASNLCAKVEVLERTQLAHRDLSVTNVMIDTARGVHLIDWDSLYAPSLRMPANTICGSIGYTAPFVRDDDPSSTWTVGGDRFAMAVLILETFAARAGCAMNGDGSLLEQSELTARGGPTIDDALAAAARHTDALGPLFTQAMHARAALECPSPADWARSLRRVTVTRSGARRHSVPGHFVPLDMSIFVPLDRSRFTPLYPGGRP